MRIRIQSGDTNLRLWFPTNLVFSRCTVYLANTLGRKYAGDAMKNIPPEALKVLFAEFRRIKRKYGTWELVDIESSDASVKIIL